MMVGPTCRRRPRSARVKVALLLPAASLKPTGPVVKSASSVWSSAPASEWSAVHPLAGQPPRPTAMSDWFEVQNVSFDGAAPSDQRRSEPGPTSQELPVTSHWNCNVNIKEDGLLPTREDTGALIRWCSGGGIFGTRYGVSKVPPSRLVDLTKCRGDNVSYRSSSRTTPASW